MEAYPIKFINAVQNLHIRKCDLTPTVIKGKNHKLPGDISNLGGLTLAYKVGIAPTDSSTTADAKLKVTIAHQRCHSSDNFNRALGRAKAKTKLFQVLDGVDDADFTNDNFAIITCCNEKPVVDTLVLSYAFVHLVSESNVDNKVLAVHRNAVVLMERSHVKMLFDVLDQVPPYLIYDPLSGVTGMMLNKLLCK